SAADRFNVGLKLLLARTYAQSRDRQGAEAAEKIYQELADKSPSPEVYRGLFRLYRDQPRLGLKKALTLLNQTLDQAKNQQAGPNPARPQAESMIAALRDDAVLAQDLVQVAYQQAARDQTLKIQTLLLLGALADRNRQLDQAERFYRQSLPLASPQTEAVLYSG